MQLAGDPWPDLDHASREEVRIILLNYLEGPWGSLPANAAAMAYFEANSATRYLIERWGMARIDELLSAFKAGQSVAAALQTKLFVSYEQFHRDWLERFEKHRT